jgi:hypothetical protein
VRPAPPWLVGRDVARGQRSSEPIPRLTGVLAAMRLGDPRLGGPGELEAPRRWLRLGRSTIRGVLPCSAGNRLVPDAWTGIPPVGSGGGYRAGPPPWERVA